MPSTAPSPYNLGVMPTVAAPTRIMIGTFAGLGVGLVGAYLFTRSGSVLPPVSTHAEREVASATAFFTSSIITIGVVMGSILGRALSAKAPA